LETATLSSKGQLVIPRKVRELANLAAGDAFQVQYANGEIHLRPLVRSKSSTVEEVAGCLARSSGMRLTEAQTMTAIKVRLKAEDAATMTAARPVRKTALPKTAP
jgi:AbrB family looped-hinge helix DNA binding protein